MAPTCSSRLLSSPKVLLAPFSQSSWGPLKERQLSLSDLCPLGSLTWQSQLEPAPSGSPAPLQGPTLPGPRQLRSREQ